jgi:hypothetical protein
MDATEREFTERFRAWALVLGIWALVFLPPCQLGAQVVPASAVVSSNRYLLVVDTSRSMQRRSDATLRAVQDLLGSGMRGQFRRGDTLGVWTFNAELYTGRFPLQRWSPETQANITAATVSFLREQKYEKQSSFEQLLPALDRLVKQSDFLTIILISDGREEIAGTPFDQRINDFYRLWRDEQQRALMPFSTILRARAGHITDFSVNPAPWPVEMPPLLADSQAAGTDKNAPKIQPPTAPPLIISGKAKRAETTNAAKAPEPAPLKPETVLPPVRSVDVSKEQASVVPATPAKSESEAPRPVLAKTESPARAPQQVKTEPAPAVAAKDLTGPTQSASPLPSPVGEPKTESAKAPGPNPPNEPLVKSEPAPPPAAPVSKPKPVRTEAPQPAPTLVTSTAPPPRQPSAPTEASPVAPPLHAPLTAVLPPATNAPSSGRPRFVAQAATAIPPEPFFARPSFQLAGFVLVGVGFSILFVLTRRSRSGPHPSLITRSFNEKEK